MKYTWWRSGDYNAICDVCGFKYKASQLQQRWDGLMVCPEDWEIRHPQEMIRPIPDQNKLPWTRPDIPVADVTYVSGSATYYLLPSVPVPGETICFTIPSTSIGPIYFNVPTDSDSLVPPTVTGPIALYPQTTTDGYLTAGTSYCFLFDGVNERLAVVGVGASTGSTTVSGVSASTATGVGASTGSATVTGITSNPPALNFSASLVTLPTSATTWTSIAYSQADSKYAIASRSSNRGGYSSNGVNWSASTLTSSGNWAPMTRGTSSGVVLLNTNSNAVQNGGFSTWTAHTTNTSPTWAWLMCNGTAVLAIPSNGASNCEYSSDSGSTWTSSGVVGTGSISSAAGVNTPSSLTIAAGNSTGKVFVCNDNFGATWVSQTVSFTGAVSIAANGTGAVGPVAGRFCAVEYGTNKVGITDDGLSWTYSTLPASRNWCGVVWCGNAWVAVAESSNKCATSINGIDWVEQTLPATASSGRLGFPCLADTNGQLTQTVFLHGSASQAILINTI